MITYLCIKIPLKGDREGICVVCGGKTEEGHPLPFSDNFTGYSYLTYGDCMCPHCFTFFKDQNFRKKSWVVTEKQVNFLKRCEIIAEIIDPPEPPFAIYITQTGQRQGWLNGMKFINYSQDRFYIMTDFAGCILADRKEAHIMNEIIKALRVRKVSKTQLRTGDFTMYIYKKSVENNWQHLIDEARKHIKKPLWEVMLYAAE